MMGWEDNCGTFGDHGDTNDKEEKMSYSPQFNAFSLNNRLIVEAYVSDRSLKSTGTGFALIQQKVSVKGLKLLMDARLPSLGEISVDGITAPIVLIKGSTVYIREELLHTQPWAQKPLESEAVEGKFMIVDMSNVEFVVPLGSK